MSTAPTVTPTDAARSAEHDHGVHGDQEDDVEVRREDGALVRRVQRTGDARDAGADRERHQLQPVHRHRHELGRELVLAERAPRATGPRPVQEVEERHDEDERPEGDVVVALERDDPPPEELERVDVRDAVGAARECRVDQDDEPELEEEERHDREVVADEAPRR